ncbi:MAG: cell division protein FtsA, partial [Candidatus Paceibacterota bacterium]
EVDSLIAEMEGMLKNVTFHEAVVGVNDPNLETRVSKGVAVVSRPNQEIGEEDKERARKAAQAFALPSNRVLVQSAFKSYLIDGISKVKDPLGMKGLKIEVECLMFDAFAPVIKNIDRLSEMINIDLTPEIVLPFAGAEIALSPQDKDLGAVALDLGAGTTGYCVYENNEILDLKIFPLGGNNVTNDIAVGLKTYVDVAEKIKINEGAALGKKIAKGDFFDINHYWEEADSETKVSKKFVAEIMEARLLEIFDLISERLKQIDRFGKLPGGIVLYGGGAKISFITELAKEKFKLPVRIAKPEIEWYKENPDPSLIPVLGLLQQKYQRTKTESESFTFKGGPLGKIFNTFKNIFSV